MDEDRFQSLNGDCRINYCSTGHGENAVLFLPGALGSGKTDFLPQLEGKVCTLFKLESYISMRAFAQE